MSKKVVIGLDGLDPGLVEEWLDDLPNLKRLIKKGTFKRMTSTIPPITVPAWMSMFSGKDPGELDAFDFQFFDKNTKRFRIFNSNYWKKHMMWTDSNKTWCVLDVPGTYPPYKIKGYMKGGFLSINTRATYPKELMDEFEKDNETLKFDNLEKSASFTKKKKVLLSNFKERLRFADWLFNNKEWDYFVFVIRITDETMHCAEKKEQIKEAYEIADSNISRYIDGALNGDYELYITSDHGCKEVRYKFYMNRWLIDNGYLHLEKEDSAVKRCIIKASGTLLNLGLKPVLEFGNNLFEKIFKKKFFQPTLSITEQAIDWKRTKAFAQVTGASNHIGVWMNPEKEDKKVIKELHKKIEGIKEVEKAYKKEEAYPKRSGDKMPDLVVKLKDEYVALSGVSPQLVVKRKAFVHDQEGVFISSRKLDIKQKKIKITDLVRYLR